MDTRIESFAGYSFDYGLEPVIKEYILEAVKIEKAGLKVKSKPVSDYSVPEEFQK